MYDNQSIVPSLEDINSIYTSILDQLQNDVNDDNNNITSFTIDVSNQFLQLYEIQHTLYDTIEQQESILEQLYNNKNTSGVTSTNNNTNTTDSTKSIVNQYEELYILQQIQYYENQFNTTNFPNLIQFAKEEMITENDMITSSNNNIIDQNTNGDVSVTTTTTTPNNNQGTTSTTIVMEIDNDDMDIDNENKNNNYNNNNYNNNITTEKQLSSSATTKTATTLVPSDVQNRISIVTDDPIKITNINIDKEIVQQFLLRNNLQLDLIDNNENNDNDTNSNKNNIIQYLQSCINERYTLLHHIYTETNSIQLLQQSIQIQNDILQNNIPIQLTSLDRIINTFSKVLYNSNNTTMNTGNTFPVQHMTGNDRIQRIQIAQQLPIPLYTTYQSIQYYIDIQMTKKNTNNTTINNNNFNGKVTIDPTNNEVILHLPVLDIANMTTNTNSNSTTAQISNTTTNNTNSNTNAISTSNNNTKMVYIHFVYNTNPIPYISVYCTNANSLLNQDILFDELFPYDYPINHYDYTNSNTTNTTSSNTVRGKSYIWCNHLAGLHPVPESTSNRSNDNTTTNNNSMTKTVNQQQQIHTSTRIVIREIQRRIRSNATLKYILHLLCRLRIPTIPNNNTSSISSSSANIDPNWKSQCKLISFTNNIITNSTTTNNNNGIQESTTYNVEIRRGNTTNSSNTTIASNTPPQQQPSIYGTVQISNTRYPAIVPKWEFHYFGIKSITISNNNNNNQNNHADNSDTDLKLYDTHLEQLKHRVNVELLDIITQKQSVVSKRDMNPNTSTDNMNNNTNEMKDSVPYDDEEEDVSILQYCEWILVHQIREIMYYVDTIPWNNNDGGNDNMNINLYKGRDRQLR